MSYVKLRFALKKHLASRLHFDLRLEYQGILISFVILHMDFNVTQEVIKVEDHDIECGLTERIIVFGRGIGITLLSDQGDWDPIGDVDESLDRGLLEFYLFGKKLSGKFTARRIGTTDRWTLSKMQDLRIENNNRWRKEESVDDLILVLAKRFPKLWVTNPPAITPIGGRKLLRYVISEALKLRKRYDDQEPLLF